jgi:hypothetical protein
MTPGERGSVRPTPVPPNEPSGPIETLRDPPYQPEIGPATPTPPPPPTDGAGDPSA